jgi:predicted metalloenzyme YecM
MSLWQVNHIAIRLADHTSASHLSCNLVNVGELHLCNQLVHVRDGIVSGMHQLAGLI